MAKTNFDKVEDVFDDGVQKIKAAKLQNASVSVTKMNRTPESLRPARQRIEAILERKRKQRHLIVKSLEIDIDNLFRINRHLYTLLGTYHDEFIDLAASVDSMNEKKWDRLLEIKEKLDEYKSSMESNTKGMTDRQRVESERKKQINKRYNVKDTWLPLQ